MNSPAQSGGLTKTNAELIDQIIAERSKNSKFEFFRENTRLKPPDEPVIRKQKITRSRTNSETEDLYQEFQQPSPIKQKKDPYREFVGSHVTGPVWKHSNTRPGSQNENFHTGRFNPRQAGQVQQQDTRTLSRQSEKSNRRNKGAKLDPFASFVNSIVGDNPVNRVENFPNRLPSPPRKQVQKNPIREDRTQLNGNRGPSQNGTRNAVPRQKLINDDEPAAPSSAFNNVYYKNKDRKDVKNEKGAAFAAFLDQHTNEQPAWKHLDSKSALKMMRDDAKRDINKMLPLMGDINGYTEDQESFEDTYRNRKSQHPKGNAFAAFVNSISEGQPVNIAGQPKPKKVQQQKPTTNRRSTKKKKDAFSEFVNSHTDGPLFASGTSGGTNNDLEAIRRFDSSSSLNSLKSGKQENKAETSSSQKSTSKKQSGQRGQKTSRRTGGEKAPRRKKADAFAQFVGQHTDGPLFKPEKGKSALEMEGLKDKNALKISQTLDAVRRFDTEVGSNLTRVPDDHQPGDVLEQETKIKPEKKLTQKPAQPGLYANKGGAFQEFVNSALTEESNEMQEETYEIEPEERILNIYFQWVERQKAL